MQEELDPELAAVVDDVEAMGLPQWSDLCVSSARRVEDEVFSAGDAPTVETVRDLAFAGPAGDVPVRVYRPATADGDALPTIVYYHGGGWVTGTLDSIDGLCRRLATRAPAVVVSVDYRLAPEHPFPAAVDDAAAALSWVASVAADLGGDPDRLAVAGTSAGANLAAAVSLRATRALEGDDSPPEPDAQALFYPILDHDCTTESYEANADGPLLTREDMVWFWAQYLRSPVDGANPYASVLRAPNLSGVAPAVVVTAGHDVLRDEGVAYADRLADAGVETIHHHYPTMCHGFLSLTDDVTVADDALDTAIEALLARLG
jgi:acetyl esterase